MTRRKQGGAAARQATRRGPAPAPNPAALTQDYFGGRVPRDEQWRTHYGRALDLNRIEYAIRCANRGLMRPLTDLGRETVSLDGHLSALLQKRLNRLAALDFDIQPATGDDLDTDKAELYAAFVRHQIEQIPNFRDRITDLGWAVFDGRAASELAWRYDSREWALVDIHWIHPRRLSFGPHRDLRVIDSSREGASFADVGFPLERVPYKFVTYKPRLFGDYQEREGLAPRTLYWSFFARFGTRERMMLLELFGRPWRIVRPIEGESPNIESQVSAFEAAKNLGAHNTARLPPGMQLDIHNPFTGAGQVSAEAIDHATKVLSKLFLGSTGTTDAVSTGLGSSIGDAHLSEEDLVIWSDARRLAEALEDQITDSIIAVNFGPDELVHAPRFLFRTEPPLDREGEAARLRSALELGLEVSLDEAREKLGVRETREGQPVIKRVTRPAELGMLPPAPANEIVYPIGEAPPPGELADAPLVGLGLPEPAPAPALPAAPPPAPPAALPAAAAADDDAELALGPDVALDELCAKMNEHAVAMCEHGKKNRCRLCGIERVRDFDIGPSGEPEWIVRWRPIRGAVAAPAVPAPTLRAEGGAPAALDGLEDLDDDELGDVFAARACAHHAHGLIVLAEQPRTVNGSPEQMVDRGVAETAARTAELAEVLVDAVSGKRDGRAIRAAIEAAAGRLSKKKLAEPIERELLHGGMLGALDAAFEAEHDTAVAPASFTDLHRAIWLADPFRDTSFAARPIKEAIASFLKKEAVTRDVFDAMETSAQRKAFTVARMATDAMVKTVKRELVRQIAVGADLRDFGRYAAKRFEQAGWVPANASHVETIFRTNVINAYNGGRVRQMSDPVVAAHRPFWEVLGVRDGRQRVSHRAAHGVVLRHDDPIWQEAAPPFGYNCRCRLRSLSIKAGAGRVREGREAFRDLPDRGFASGVATLL